MTGAHDAEYFRVRRRSLGIAERGDYFPNSIQIQRQAKELRLMESLPLAEFIELYEPRLKPKKKAIMGTPKPIPSFNSVSLDQSQQQIMHRALRRSLRIIG